MQPYLKGECYLMDYDTINLLGLQPDDIQDIDIININVTLIKKIKSCSCCSSLNANVKDYKSKKITHSIFNTNKTVINYRCRRFVCKDCHKTFLEDNPFIEVAHRISTATVMQVLKDCKRLNYTFTSIAQKNHISPTTVINVCLIAL